MRNIALFLEVHFATRVMKIGIQPFLWFRPGFDGGFWRQWWFGPFYMELVDLGD